MVSECEASVHALFEMTTYDGHMPDLRRAAFRTAASVAGAATAAYSVLLSEALLARRTIGITDARPPSADGLYGPDLAARPVSCLILGDSAAVGYGMERADDTPPGLFGIGLAHVLGRPVRITTHAKVGARTSDLAAQISQGLSINPDVAVIVIGTNDVTHQVPPTVSAHALRHAVRKLIASNCQVIVGTTPDLGTIQPIKQPLRTWARMLSRRLAQKQAVVVIEEGGIAISLGGLLGPIFAEQRDVMFGADHFHPSAEGYANMVSVMIPAMAATIRRSAVESFWDGAPHTTSDWTDAPRDTSTVEQAASRASKHEGTEVTRSGRFASIRRRRVPRRRR